MTSPAQPPFFDPVPELLQLAMDTADAHMHTAQALIAAGDRAGAALASAQANAIAHLGLNMCALLRTPPSALAQALAKAMAKPRGA